MHQLAIAIACYSYITIPAIFSECSYTVATIVTFSNIFSVYSIYYKVFIARQTAILIISKMKNNHSVKQL